MTRRWFLLAAVLVAAPLTAYGGYRGLRSLSFFRVRRIELVGGRYLDAEAIARAIAVPGGTSTFDGTGVFEVRARKVPGVLAARVSRRIPGTLRVTIVEAEPVALVERGGRLLLMDAGAHALPFDPTRPAADLPLAEPDSTVARLLARARELGPEVYGRIEHAARLKRDVSVEVDRGRLLFRAGAPVADLRNLFLVADLLTRQGKPWRELDGRYLPHVIIRGGA